MRHSTLSLKYLSVPGYTAAGSHTAFLLKEAKEYTKRKGKDTVIKKGTEVLFMSCPDVTAPVEVTVVATLKYDVQVSPLSSQPSSTLVVVIMMSHVQFCSCTVALRFEVHRMRSTPTWHLK